MTAGWVQLERIRLAELEQARRRVSQALDAAHQAWAIWADAIAMRREEALGLPPGDAWATQDPEYLAALDAGDPIEHVRRAWRETHDDRR